MMKKEDATRLSVVVGARSRVKSEMPQNPWRALEKNTCEFSLIFSFPLMLSLSGHWQNNLRQHRQHRQQHFSLRQQHASLLDPAARPR
jgi:hypothetical protein